jgi:UDP-N-acetylglucosamine transferase subunit ALG13
LEKFISKIETLELPRDGLAQSGADIYTYLSHAQITRETQATILETIDKTITCLFGKGKLSLINSIHFISFLFLFQIFSFIFYYALM